VADAIALEGVSFAYPGSPPLLHDVDMRVGVGEVVALVGPTGSGKSTLLSICAGIIPHYQAGDLRGSVSVLGIDTKEASLGAVAAVAGVVTQDPENQLFNLFVQDEVAWGMENRGASVEEMHKRIGEALEFFKIPHLRDRITYDLSGGEKQRVVLAATYAPRPGLFLLDGPTSQLDPLGTEEVLAGVGALAAEGNTIVLVEEKLEELWGLVDRVLLLNGGTIQLDIERDDMHDYVHALEDAGIPLPPLVELGALLRDRGHDVPPLPPLPSDAATVLRAHAPDIGGAVASAPASAPERDTAPSLLSVGGLSFTYPPPRRTEALRNVDLELPPRSIVAVVGHNGSGKTTLARCISGDLRPDRGFVRVEDEDVHGMSVRRRASRVGYVFQNPDHQVFKDPVLEDVAFGPLNLGMPRDQALEVSERVLRALNLWDKRDVHPFRLSKGDRQRLAIAGVAVMRPPLVIIDEPTTGQDLVEANAIMSLLAEMAREGNQTVVVITHAMELVAAYADLVVALNEGEVLAFGPPEVVFRDEDRLRSTFVKPPSVTALGNRLGLEPRPLTLEQAAEALAGALSAVREVARE
jgi:energy-coupling factor transporter ATP-binding protein EcfA2